MKFVLVLALLACRDRERPKPAPPLEVAMPSEAELRTQCALSAAERGGKFVVTDAAKLFEIALPRAPELRGDLVTEGDEQAFHAQAISVGGDVDVQVGVISMRDGQLPPAIDETFTKAAFEIAEASGGGDIQRNTSGTLAGVPAHVFELVAKGRRLLGWYVKQRGRLYQINCSGPEGDTTRVACDEIASSLRLVGARP